VVATAVPVLAGTATTMRAANPVTDCPGATRCQLHTWDFGMYLSGGTIAVDVGIASGTPGH
jgi:hypothetical protein